MNCVPDGCGEGPTRAELRRRKLIDTARRLFVEKGFHATGIAQIARESDIAVGQIYRDFASKEDIVAAIVETDCGAYAQVDELDAAIRAGDAVAARAWLKHFIDIEKDPDDGRLFAEIVAESSRNERIAAMFVAVQNDMRDNLLRALALLSPGEERAEQRAVLADMVVTFSLGLLHYQLMRPALDAVPLVGALQTLIDDQIGALTS